MNAVCPECWPVYLSWLDYRLPRSLRIANNASRDMEVAGVVDGQRARFEQWRATVNQQQGLIRELCARRHGLQVGVVA